MTSPRPASEPPLTGAPAPSLTAAVAPPARVRHGSIGVMGGTFDPIHLGHLVVAEEAREILGLDRILFTPAGQPPHKPIGSASPASDRVAMVERAIAGAPAFELCRADVNRPGPSYTADLLGILAAAETAAGRTPDLTLILSADSFRDLPTWHDPARLLRTCAVAVAPRGGYPAPDRSWIEAILPGAGDRVTILPGPHLDISSTAIRARVAAARSIRYLVPDAVAAYVAEHRLYRGATDAHDRRDRRP